MAMKKITAISRSEKLADVENRLKNLEIPGITVDHVRGYGEYANFFARDWMTRYARIEIVIEEHGVDRIIDAICRAVHTGSPGDGFVYSVPVDRVCRIRDRRSESATS